MSAENGHIGIEGLLALREELSSVKGAAGSDAAAHVATCTDCFARYTSLDRLASGFSAAMPEKERGPACPPEWEIGAALREEMPPQASEAVFRHMDRCDACRDQAAMFFRRLSKEAPALAAPKAWRDAAARAIAVAPRTASAPAGESPLRRWIGLLRETISGFSPLPAYAVAGASLAGLVLTLVVGREQGAVLVVPSSERIAWSEASPPPSLGFMNGPPAEEPVTMMELRTTRVAVVLAWKPVEGAVAYTFSLAEAVSGKEIVSRGERKDPEAEVGKDLLKKGGFYAWRIGGKTAAGKRFDYRGTFVWTG